MDSSFTFTIWTLCCILYWPWQHCSLTNNYIPVILSNILNIVLQYSFFFHVTQPAYQTLKIKIYKMSLHLIFTCPPPKIHIKLGSWPLKSIFNLIWSPLYWRCLTYIGIYLYILSHCTLQQCTRHHTCQRKHSPLYRLPI